jgi:hypothetical protein
MTRTYYCNRRALVGASHRRLCAKSIGTSLGPFCDIVIVLLCRGEKLGSCPFRWPTHSNHNSEDLYEQNDRNKRRPLVAIVGVTVAFAQNGSDFFLPGNLVVSRSVYDNRPANVQVGDALPPNCVSPNCQSAINDGTYPFVWNNDLVDGSFGITSRILLDQLTPNWRAHQLARGSKQLTERRTPDEGSSRDELFLKI